MGDLVNLNRHRKAKARAERAARAAENRAQFGESKADKARRRQAADLAKRQADGARLDPGPEKT